MWLRGRTRHPALRRALEDRSPAGRAASTAARSPGSGRQPSGRRSTIHSTTAAPLRLARGPQVAASRAADQRTRKPASVLVRRVARGAGVVPSPHSRR
eukprot:scaffold42336_cov36-Tisochrysis_lutea.AAC.1